MSSLKDINFNIGSVNQSGIGDSIFFIPKKDIIAYPWITDDIQQAMLDGSYVSYGNFMGDPDAEDNNFILHPDKYWHYLYSTPGKGKITWEMLGETDHKVVKNKASFFFPKLNVIIRMMAKLSQNGDFVFVIYHEGRYYVVGSWNYRAVMSLVGDSGDVPGSYHGVTLNIESPDTTPLPVYQGVLAMATGYLDCKTNQFIKYSDMATNYPQTYPIVGGNTVIFSALGELGRIHLEGTGSITMDVSVDGVAWKGVSHSVAFENGKAIVPCQFVIGDKVRISATTLTKCIVNYSKVNAAERV